MLIELEVWKEMPDVTIYTLPLPYASLSVHRCDDKDGFTIHLMSKGLTIDRIGFVPTGAPLSEWNLMFKYAAEVCKENGRIPVRG